MCFSNEAFQLQVRDKCTKDICNLHDHMWNKLNINLFVQIKWIVLLSLLSNQIKHGKSQRLKHIDCKCTVLNFWSMKQIKKIRYSVSYTPFTPKLKHV